MDRIILHEQSHWADVNSATALADAIERQCGQDLGHLGRGAAMAVPGQLAWPRVFDRLFSIYREVIAGYPPRSR